MFLTLRDSDLKALTTLNAGGIHWDCTCEKLWWIEYVATHGMRITSEMLCYTPLSYYGESKFLVYRYPVKITNSSLYNKCEEHPLSIYILENRWRLFGHILRRNIEIPANKSMNSYFATHGKKFRGRPLTTLPVVLNKDLSRLQENTLQLTTREDLEHLRCIAQNRQQWRELSTRIRKAAEAPPSDD